MFLALVLTLNVISMVQTTVTWNQEAFLTLVVTTVVVFIVFGMQRYLSNYIQLLTLLILVIYHVSRFYTITFEYKKYVRGSLFFAGYAIAVTQSILIFRIQKIRHKIYGSIIAYVIRFGLIMGVADHQSFSYYTMARGIVGDFFLVYIHYTSQQTERRVFKNFYENKQELLKFKELLAESLPQSVTVLDCSTLKLLFRNATFQNSFTEQEKCFTDDFMVKTSPRNEGAEKINFNLLRVEGGTIRESGGEEMPLKISGGLHLKEVINNLIKSDLFKEKAVSLIAFSTSQAQKKSFEIILKKIVWDRADALALILNDITYQENLIALKVANRNKDQIIATVSHELRTPLHGIIGLVELADPKMPDESGKEYLSLCKSNALLLLDLVNSLLDLHQLSTGKIKLNIVQVHLENMLKDVVKLFQFQAKQKKLLLKFDIFKPVPEFIETDESRLRQILINLIGNAIKFTSQGGVTIEISQTEKEGEYLQVAVVDTGIGIQEVDQAKLFQMYGRLKDGEALNKNGVGLGLTISNTLVSILNGNDEKGRNIRILSEYKKGSRFSFKILKNLKENQSVEVIPKREEENKNRKRWGFSVEKVESESRDTDDLKSEPLLIEEGLDELLVTDDINLKILEYSSQNKQTYRSLDSPRLPTTQDLKKPQNIMMASAFSIPKFGGESKESLILQRISDSNRSTFREKYIVVVDDNPFNLLIAESLVRNLGFSICPFIGGNELIKDIKKLFNQSKDIQAILMDCQMPVMDGFETTKILMRMMENKEIPEIPVIAWTANNTQEDIQRCHECGMKDHLVKPTSAEAFSKVLAKII